MSVKLTPGGNVPLTKENPNLDNIIVGFGWNVIQGNGPQLELVPSAVITNDKSEALSDEHFVFFNQLASPEGSVRYVEGNDVEQVEFTLSKAPAAVSKVVFIVYVNPDVRNAGSFKSVKNAYIRIADDNNKELVRFDIDADDNPDINAMIFGEVYKHNGDWKFRAIGQGYSNGIAGVARDFKVEL